MAHLVNPEIAVALYGADVSVINGLHMEYEINKDLTEDPNDATLTIYNLNADTRSRLLDPSINDIPIAILLTPFGSSTLQLAYLGEIESVKNTPTRPGYKTRIECLSQKWFHRSRYIEKNYEAGTPIDTIITDFVDAIGLPSKFEHGLPDTGILLSQTFSGPAFPLLEAFLHDAGMFCYILDGVLTVSSVYEPITPDLIEIPDSILLTKPQPIERSDAIDVERHTVTEMTNIDPFRKQGKRQKKAKPKKAVSKNDWVDINKVRKIADEQKKNKTADERAENNLFEYQAIDTVIHGVEWEMLSLPTLQPDNFVTFTDVDEKQYRAQELTHYGDNFGGGMTTRVTADDFEGDTTLGGAF